MSCGPDQNDNFRRAATYVDKILKRRNPVDLHVEQPMKFEFIINLKAAKQHGLSIRFLGATNKKIRALKEEERVDERFVKKLEQEGRF
jgi:ABC-type uncharacterized transport system substrate-binding protein